MLKKLGLKNRLHALTVLLIVSVVLLISGCAGVTQKKAFYPEYYAARQLQNQDIVKLRELTVSPDSFIADSATLLLGSYYLYYGDENYARILIDKSYQSKNLDEEMSIFGQLWKMESLIRDGEKGVAINIANNIKEMKRTPAYMRALQIYCNQLGVLVVGDDEINKCIDFAVNGKEKFKSTPEITAENSPELPISTDDMTYEEYLEAIGIGGAVDSLEGSEMQIEEPETVSLESDAKINITGGDIFDDIAQGMIFAMGKFDNNYQLTPVSDFAADEEDTKSMLLRLNSQNLFIGGIKSNLDANWLGLSELAGSLGLVRNKNIVVIVATENRMAQGRIVADAVQAIGKKAYLVSYEENYQAELRIILENRKEERYNIMVLADEKEIMDIVPIAQYWKVNSRLQDVVIVTGICPNIYANVDKTNYFKGVYILTESNLLNNKRFKDVSKDYEGFLGKPMSARTALGYDIMAYINNVVEKKNEAYLTDIKEIVDGYAVRTPQLLYISNNGIVVKETFENIYNKPE